MDGWSVAKGLGGFAIQHFFAAAFAISFPLIADNEHQGRHMDQVWCKAVVDDRGLGRKTTELSRSGGTA